MSEPRTESALSTDQDSTTPLHPAPVTEVVTSWKVACSGDEALGLGHPLVWLSISSVTGWVDCPYCDKRFVVDRDHASGGEH